MKKSELKELVKEVLEEGPKKYPGVSKKAKGGVGWAKHARKGPAKQFNKGVRQAGKKQCMQGEAGTKKNRAVPIIEKHAKALYKELKSMARKYADDDYYDMPQALLSRMANTGIQYGTRAATDLKKIKMSHNTHLGELEDAIFMGSNANIMGMIGNISVEAAEFFQDQII